MCCTQSGSLGCSGEIVSLCRYLTNRWDWGRIIGSGGMPSSHTAFIVGATAGTGLKDGLDSSIFALGVVLSLIVAYDATGVRRAAGRHAAVLNALLSDLPVHHAAHALLEPGEQLRISLGHQPWEVLWGALLGLASALLMHSVFY